MFKKYNLQSFFTFHLSLKCCHLVQIVHQLHGSEVRPPKITCNQCGSDPATLLYGLDISYSIFGTFSKAFRKEVTPSALIALFGVARTGSQLLANGNTMLALCSLLARRLILLKRKDPTQSRDLGSHVAVQIREDQMHNQGIY